MKYSFRAIILLLLSVGIHPAHGQSVNVGFPEPAYQIQLGQVFEAPVRMDPMPPAGLFSYGLIVTVEGTNGLIGVTTLMPKSPLGFDGINGPGNRGVAAATGRFTSKGTANMFPAEKPNHREPDLGKVSIAGLPGGTYTVRLGPYNTLGPTESIFVDGKCRDMDAMIAFGTTQITVVSQPQGIITAVGPMLADRQTGLLTQRYEISNTGQVAARFRILIRNMPIGSMVWNAHGMIDGVPYIDLPTAAAPGSTQSLTIEYRSQDRTTIPDPQFEITTADPEPQGPDGITAALQPRASLQGGNILIEFNSVAGQGYYIQYSQDASSWKTALPKIEGTGNRIQWIDNGLPKTDSHPSTASTRFYRIMVANPSNP